MTIGVLQGEQVIARTQHSAVRSIERRLTVYFGRCPSRGYHSFEHLKPFRIRVTGRLTNTASGRWTLSASVCRVTEPMICSRSLVHKRFDQLVENLDRLRQRPDIAVAERGHLFVQQGAILGA